MALESSPQSVISEYFLRVNAQQEPIDLLDGVVETIFDERNDLQNREFHLASLLYSNPNPSVDYIVAFVKAALKVDGFSDKDKISLPPRQNKKIVSVAGSGKKGIKTINISTPSSIVAASMGAQVVKHASRGTSSLSGSSDFFAEIGGQILDTHGTLEVFGKTGFGLFSIEGTIPRFDSLYGGRVLTPTALSYALPAMVSPVKTDAVFYGLSMPRIRESVLAMHKLGFSDVVVANSTDDDVRYIDEAGLFKANSVVHSLVNGQDSGLTIVDPVKTLGLDSRRPIKSILQKGTRTENIGESLRVLRGRGEQVQTEVFALNAALILCLAGVVDNMRDAFQQALIEIASARPYDKLLEIIEASGGKFNSDQY